MTKRAKRRMMQTDARIRAIWAVRAIWAARDQAIINAMLAGEAP